MKSAVACLELVALMFAPHFRSCSAAPLCPCCVAVVVVAIAVMKTITAVLYMVQQCAAEVVVGDELKKKRHEGGNHPGQPHHQLRGNRRLFAMATQLAI